MGRFTNYSKTVCCFMMVLVGSLNLATKVQAAGVFLLTDDMNDPRTSHSATLLSDGTVLVAGGREGTSNLASAEIFDPVTELFSPTDSLNTAREGHVATRLADGTVLITGGQGDSGILASAEIYDPATGTFTTLSNSLTTPRTTHTATLLEDGTVLIAAGLGTSGKLSSAEIYNPVTDTFTALSATLNGARNAHQAVRLNDGRVLITGGYHPASAGGGGRSDAEIYDPDTQTFAFTSSDMTSTHNVHTATLLNDGSVFVAGGLAGFVSLPDTTLYDPSSDSFSDSGDMLEARVETAAALLNDGTVLIAGGMDYGSLTALNSAEIFDPATTAFAVADNLNVARFGHQATRLSDGRVLISGGESSSGTLASAEIYTDDPCGSEAAEIASLEAAIATTESALSVIIDSIESSLSVTAIPGGTSIEQLQNLATAIQNLNQGQKNGLKKNLTRL